MPLGTPLIAGPGVIAATIVFSKDAHGFRDALAIGVQLVADGVRAFVKAG